MEGIQCKLIGRRLTWRFKIFINLSLLILEEKFIKELINTLHYHGGHFLWGEWERIQY